MVPRKLQVSETFHSILKSGTPYVMSLKVSFLRVSSSLGFFELCAVKSQFFKEGLRILASLRFYHSPFLKEVQLYYMYTGCCSIHCTIREKSNIVPSL